MFTSWSAPLIATAVDGPALANSTSPTSLLPGAGKYVLRASELMPGTHWQLFASGRVSTLAAAPGTLTFDLTIGGIVVFSGGAIALNTTAQTNATWFLQLLLQTRQIGSGTTAQILGVGTWTSAAVVGSTGGAANTHMLPATAPAVGSGFDSTTAAVVDLRGTWSFASASNSITLHDFMLISAAL